jgi:hypothetical protein
VSVLSIRVFTVVSKKSSRDCWALIGLECVHCLTDLDSLKCPKPFLLDPYPTASFPRGCFALRTHVLEPGAALVITVASVASEVASPKLVSETEQRDGDEDVRPSPREPFRDGHQSILRVRFIRPKYSL